MAAVGVALVALGCACETALAATPYKSTVRRTAYGMPHIEAKNFLGLGFGYGYAIAEDNICVLAETYATVDAERARWFGPGGEYQQRGNGVTVNNLDSDFFFQQINDSKVVENLRDQPPPNGLEPEGRQVVRGYVQGYNKYLKDVGGSKGVRDPACRGKPWVRRISELQAYRRFYQLVLLASADVAMPGIAKAQPPTPQTSGGGGGGLPGLPVPLGNEETARGLAEHLPIKAAGSNAVAIGRDGVRGGTRGVLLGNPHFPWLGPERFYQAHLTIPGKIDVSGASLFGVPAVLIGHTKTMAWSHTVSTAFRFTPYQLNLVPGSPTTFLRDGRPVEMTSRDVAVSVPVDGKACADSGCPVATSTRRLWTAPGIGPVFNELVGIPLPWTTNTAFALRDANAANFRAFNHFFATNKAKSAKEELAVLERYQGIPWVNTIVADKAGDALYADIGAIPNVPNSKAESCNTALGTATFRLLGLPVLDATRSACDWDTDPDSREPGLFGASKMPRLMRSDYVTNSNDSYWLSNPKAPIEGFARIIGDERAERSLRTRIGLLMTQARVDGSDGLGPAGFTRQDMQNMVFSNRQYGGELTRDAAVEMCRSFPGGMAPSSSGSVPVGEACNILGAWDLHENLDSRGAILFRRFISRFMTSNASPVADAVRPRRPGQYAARPEHRQRRGAARVRRRHQRPERRGHQARRRAVGRAVHDPRRPEGADPRRAGRPERAVQRDLRAVHLRHRVPGRSARVVLRAGRRVQPLVLPRRAHDPDLLAVDRPELAALRRPDRAVQPQEVGARPVLPQGRAEGDQGDYCAGAR